MTTGELYVVAGPPFAMTADLAGALSRDRNWYLMPAHAVVRDDHSVWPDVVNLGLRVPWHKPVIIADIIRRPGDALNLFNLANLMGRQLTRVFWVLETRADSLRRAGADRFEEVAEDWDEYRARVLPEMEVVRHYRVLSTLPVTGNLDKLLVDALAALAQPPQTDLTPHARACGYREPSVSGGSHYYCCVILK